MEHTGFRPGIPSVSQIGTKGTVEVYGLDNFHSCAVHSDSANLLLLQPMYNKFALKR